MSRGEKLGLLTLVVGMVASLAWLVHPWYDATNDASMYILTARSLIEGDGYSMLGSAFRIRPPGFTALLAPLLALRGTDFYAFNLYVSAFGVAGVALLFVFVRARLGGVLAFLVCVVVWLNPGYQTLCNQTMSDVPGTALLVACLLLERWADRAPPGRARWKRNAVLGLVIGLCAYVRVATILLAPAIVAMRAVRRSTERASVETWKQLGAGACALVLAAVLVQVPWAVRNARVAPEPPVDQTLLYSYGTAMFHEDMGDPNSRALEWSEIFARFPLRGGQALSTLGMRMTDDVAGAAPVALFLLACVLIVLVKRRESNELFLLGTLLIISLYFGFADRLLLPIYVLALPAAAEVVRDVGNLVGRAFRGRARTQFGTVLAAAALVAVLVVDFAPRAHWESAQPRYELLERVTRRFEERLEPDAVLASTRAWHYAVLMERPVYALEFALRRDERPRSIEPILDKYGINTVIVTPTRARDQSTIRYLEGRYPSKKDPIAFVYRVR